MTPFLPLSDVRQRTSEKWTVFGPDVLPLFVAEMDVPLAPPIRDALAAMVARGDTGYANPEDRAAAEAFAQFAAVRWAWHVDPHAVAYTTDVSVVIVESLRRLVEPGAGVVITPPVYQPFPDMITEAGARPVPVPLVDDGDAYALDLPGIDAALAAGARAVLLCNPHNPVGLVHSRESLAALSEIVERHGASVVSDEIHAPLTHPGVGFTPYLDVSDAARAHAIAAHSGSKAFNLAGLKAALFVTASPRMRALVAALPEEVGFRTGLFGLTATRIGFAECGDWLDEVRRAIVANRELLRHELSEHLPGARLRDSDATYLAWLDLTALGWGNDPAAHALDRAQVALSRGPAFGAGGTGYARMNVACAPEVITEAVARLARAR
ncbi:aminotransferase class I/II-fold pyridoxal phosphate-dependent enzyme [Micrococcales bacterium 31B]|nr:aminotransferase class I/II-fold pyridoxal phosphate-dependent enzyme [Micrococcales bacterium 31B]